MTVFPIWDEEGALSGWRKKDGCMGGAGPVPRSRFD